MFPATVLRRIARVAAVASTALPALVALGSSTASASGGDGVPLRLTRICDPTLCYVVWGQVDSDGDGYNDADEIVAGTDPKDASSHPGPKDILQIAIDRSLPTFEAGMGAFVALPDLSAELQAKHAGIELSSVLPPGGRASTLERLGISADLLASMGIDPGAGFTIGIGAAGKPGERPPIKVGGIDMALISAGDGPMSAGPARSSEGLVSHGGVQVYTPGVTMTNEVHGGVVDRDTSLFSGTVSLTYADGYTAEARPVNSSTWEVTTKDPSGNVRSVRTEERWNEGGTAHERDTTKEYDEQGNLTSITESETINEGGGVGGTLTTTTVFHEDENGKATGITQVTTMTWTSSGGTTTTTQEVRTCDAGGENCTVDVVDTGDDDEEYVNFEADTFVLTDDVFDQVIRSRGAVVTPVPGAPNPITDGATPTDPNDPTTVALVDDQTGQTTTLVSPRITTAGPDVRPDLPNPRVALGGGMPPRGCPIGC